MSKLVLLAILCMNFIYSLEKVMQENKDCAFRLLVVLLAGVAFLG
jgi:hypothetical protein